MHALMDHLTESGNPLRKLRKAISGYMLVEECILINYIYSV